MILRYFAARNTRNRFDRFEDIRGNAFFSNQKGSKFRSLEDSFFLSFFLLLLARRNTCSMRCHLACGSTSFFFRIIMKILPMSGQLNNSLDIRIFPMNPVPPVTRTFRSENQSDIDTFDAMFIANEKSAKDFFNEEEKKACFARMPE